MIRFRKHWLLLGIFLLASLLRIYSLETTPSGFHIDEVRVGYNAYSLLNTGKDQYGNTLPLFYNSFSEYRPMGIFYATVPSILIFGKTIFATRFPTAVMGAATVFVLFYLLKRYSVTDQMAYLTVFFLAINPWHIFLSRATSEGVGSLFFALCGAFFQREAILKKRLLLILVSLFFACISLLFYPSARFFVPLFFILQWFLARKNLEFPKSFVVASSFAIFLISFIVLSFLSGTNNRLNQVFFIKNPAIAEQITQLTFGEGEGNIIRSRIFNNKVIIYSFAFFRNIATYLDPSFFLGSSIKPERYNYPTAQLVQFSIFGLVFLGLISQTSKQLKWFAFVWILLGLFPSALTYEDTPNMQRAIFMVPGVVLIASLGWQKFQQSTSKLLVTLLIVICISETMFGLHHYFVHQKSYKSFLRNQAAPELITKINQIEKNYDQILISNTPDSLALYQFYFTDTDPSAIQKIPVENWTAPEMTFGKYVFTTKSCPTEDFSEFIGRKILFIDAGDCRVPEQVGLKQKEIIRYGDSSYAYSLVEFEQ